MNNVKRAIIIGFCLAVMVSFTQAALAQDVTLTKEEALIIATGSVNIDEVGDVSSIELETEDGILLYAVEFIKDSIATDVKVDAQTGEVTIIENDVTEMEIEADDAVEEEMGDAEDTMETEGAIEVNTTEEESIEAADAMEEEDEMETSTIKMEMNAEEENGQK